MTDTPDPPPSSTALAWLDANPGAVVLHWHFKRHEWVVNYRGQSYYGVTLEAAAGWAMRAEEESNKGVKP